MRSFRLFSNKAFIAGLCSAIAYNLSLPAWLVRLIVLLFCYFTNATTFIMLYILLWILIPSGVAPKDYAERTGD